MTKQFFLLLLVVEHRFLQKYLVILAVIYILNKEQFYILFIKIFFNLNYFTDIRSSIAVENFSFRSVKRALKRDF